MEITMPAPWSVQEAKAKLSEVLALARSGAPQRIGLEESCVVVSEAAWAARGGESLGAWLADSAPRGAPLKVASRVSRRGDPFASKAARAKRGTRR
jgi:hypothetical protein